MTHKHMHFEVATYKVAGSTPDGPPKQVRSLFGYYEGDKENRMFLAGGPQHTFRQYLFDYEVVKDYGHSDDDNWCVGDIFDQYRRDFPPTPDNLEDHDRVVWDVDGWLAPTGDIYTCGWAGHSNLASDLAIGFYEHDDMYEQRADKFLLERGWIEIRHGFVHKDIKYRPFATPEQIGILRKLIELNVRFPMYAKGIERFFRQWEGRE